MAASKFALLDGHPLMTATRATAPAAPFDIPNSLRQRPTHESLPRVGAIFFLLKRMWPTRSDGTKMFMVGLDESQTDSKRPKNMA